MWKCIHTQVPLMALLVHHLKTSLVTTLDPRPASASTSTDPVQTSLAGPTDPGEGDRCDSAAPLFLHCESQPVCDQVIK